MNTLMSSNLNLPGQLNKYKGKVRDVYFLDNNLLVIVVTDRLSAFDVVMPKGIPFKGQVLNQITSKMLNSTKDIVPNWINSTPDPNVSIGVRCKPIKIEMVIRGYLSGHAARQYNQGNGELCGVILPEGMIENDKFVSPIITPATKADEGHDEDISREEIINKEIVSEIDYRKLESYTYKLFERGSELAKKKGLILVDTKYEFGTTSNGEIVLIDEIHTPDSSRYFYKDGYEERQLLKKPQKQLSKEFIRQWLISNRFQGLEGQVLPTMSNQIINEVSNRYIELYEKILGEKFKKDSTDRIESRIEGNIMRYLKSIY